MFVSKTPFRISFFGGGTDLPSFYQQNGGCVVSSSIDKHIYLSINKQFRTKGFNLKYSTNEFAKKIESIQHPIIKEVFKKFRVNNVVLSSIADLPSNSGMGSSSSFTVGLVNLCSLFADSTVLNKEQLSEEACKIEIDLLKEPIGKQDQYAASFGGFNRFHFNNDGSVDVENLNLGPSSVKLEKNLMLFHLGGSRRASSILKDQNKKIKTDNNAIENSTYLRNIAKDFCLKKLKKNIDYFGELLNENWLFKKKISNRISSEFIDQFYEDAISSGAIGGKLLGAGGAGFFLLYVREKDQMKVKTKLSEFYLENFKFENHGSIVQKL